MYQYLAKFCEKFR